MRVCSGPPISRSTSCRRSNWTSSSASPPSPTTSSAVSTGSPAGTAAPCSAAAAPRWRWENLVEADAAVEADDKGRYAELVEEFHDLLITGADNAKLGAHYRILMNQLAYSRLVTTSLSEPGRALQSDREHHNVVELIIAKDGDSAERVMRDHVRASRLALMAGLTALGNP
ncbi:FCD domain-containing protein [Streptomyces sp. NPDC002888]|uniref:FCD domain-containing protein n=1 Tax=Streptomyces sp. NPDC002888 TaxID=3364668 RepID=UPI0036C22B62